MSGSSSCGSCSQKTSYHPNGYIMPRTEFDLALIKKFDPQCSRFYKSDVSKNRVQENYVDTPKSGCGTYYSNPTNPKDECPYGGGCGNSCGCNRRA